MTPLETYEREARAHGRFLRHPGEPRWLWCATSYGRLPGYEAAKAGLIEDVVRFGPLVCGPRRYVVEGGRLRVMEVKDGG